MDQRNGHRRQPPILDAGGARRSLSRGGFVIRLCRIETSDTLRLTFGVGGDDGHEFLAYARALRSGTLVDLQASDTDLAGTTGRPVVDELIAEHVARRFAHARADATIFDFDQRSRRRAA